jgi:hypothetical protein
MITWAKEEKKIIKHYKSKMPGITTYIFRHEMPMWIKSKTQSFITYKKHMSLTETNIGLGRKCKKKFF